MVLWDSTALAHFEAGQLIMMAVGFGLLYLAIVKKFEPLLLLPIGFGALLTNIPIAGFSEVGGLLHYIYKIGDFNQASFDYQISCCNIRVAFGQYL